MAVLTEQELLDSIQRGFETALETTESILDAKDTNAGPGRLSAKFVYEVAKAIHQRLLSNHLEEAGLPSSVPELCLRVVKVDELGDKRPGEWLVDACITKELSESSTKNDRPFRFIDHIVFAIESESDTGRRAFDEDFAKLVHLNAMYKLYLNGLDHATDAGMASYMEDRRGYAESILRRVHSLGEFYLAFWPSPRKPRSSDWQVDSIWKRLDEWPHLNEIRLWRFDRCRGVLVEVPRG